MNIASVLLKHFTRLTGRGWILALTTGGVLVLAAVACAQSQPELVGEVAKMYTGSMGAESNHGAGFSAWGLIGGLLFGSIGFIAFIYGKRNEAFRPMITGLLLMGYPYFIKNTIALYLIGTALTTLLYFWRD